ncbi:MAG TPA: flagellar hook-length control protein FliK [Burkholderiaceae bacterium]|jgi:flagellar hook-length control protein FliK
MNIVNNNTSNSPAASDAALRAQAAAASSSTSSSSSGSFADMLRNFDASHINLDNGPIDLGTAQPVRPAPESAPTPPDASSNADANVARQQDGPSETQRQEARAAAAAPAPAPAAHAATTEDTPQQTQTADASDATSQPATGKAKAADEQGEGAGAKAAADSTEQTGSNDPLDKPSAKKARNAKLLLGDAAATDSKPDSAKSAQGDSAAQVQASQQPISHVRVLSADKGAADSTTNVASDSAKSAVSTQGRANARQADQTADLRADQAATRAASVGDTIQQTTQSATQSFATELRSAASGVAAGARTSTDGQAVLGALGGVGGSATTASSSNTSSTSSTTTLSLAQPLSDAGFGAELGARLTVLTQDGVQHAELHLNPADMGPVAVQISVDGQQAQISFHAAHAETRAVLEQSLPDLAAALSASGLTLAGGGVFQQSQGGQAGQSGSGAQGNGRSGSSRRVADGDDSGSAGIQHVAMPGKASRGVVDLYV